MNIRVNMFIMAFMLLSVFGVSAQSDTVYLSVTEAEELFLRRNLQLIAEKLNIDKAEAAIVQARLWQNPNFSFEGLNLWTSKAQRRGEDEIVPPLFGSFAKNTTFAVGVEQMIRLAGKRRKLIAVEQLSKDIAEQYFEELLRSLKIELRNTCNDLLYMQEYCRTLENQIQTLNRFVAGQRAQSEQGNVSKSKILRIQAEAFATGAEYNELQKEINKRQKDLKILLNLESHSYLVITEALAASLKSPDKLSYGTLLDRAVVLRPDVKAALRNVDYFEKSLKYEQSQRTPDITLKASYDRAGGIVRDFVGFGFGIDLPLFNRNQGNIRAAQVKIKQSAAEAEHQELVVRHEVGEALQNYTMAYNFVQQLENDGMTDLDEMLDNYTKNFTNRNIGVVEFLDFFEAYKGNRKIALEAKRNLSVCLEELKYAAGTEDL